MTRTTKAPVYPVDRGANVQADRLLAAINTVLDMGASHEAIQNAARLQVFQMIGMVAEVLLRLPPDVAKTEAMRFVSRLGQVAGDVVEPPAVRQPRKGKVPA